MKYTKEQQLLEEAAKRYPLEATYMPLNEDGISYEDDPGGSASDAYDVDYAPNFIEEDLIEVGCGYIYVRGKWAKVISHPLGLYLSNNNYEIY